MPFLKLLTCTKTPSKKIVSVHSSTSVEDYFWLTQRFVLHQYGIWPQAWVVFVFSYSFMESNRGRSATSISNFLNYSLWVFLKLQTRHCAYLLHTHTQGYHGHTCKMSPLMTASRLPLTHSLREWRTFWDHLVISQLSRGLGLRVRLQGILCGWENSF